MGNRDTNIKNMILIDEVLVSRDVVSTDFHCNLDKCKGACCWEGDYGAPLAANEIANMATEMTTIKSALPDAQQRKIEEDGWYRYYDEPKFDGTQLMDDGACVFMQKDEIGIAYCTIERLQKEEKIDIQKPISCHLYPIRVSRNKNTGFTALNYDKWNICDAACSLGKSMKIPVYQFVKDALVRIFGQEFYTQLDEIAHQIEDDNI